MDKAIRLGPHDASLLHWYVGKAYAYFGLTQYDQSTEWARRAIAINSNCPWPHINVIASLALTDREAEANDALQRYLALVPNAPKTIAAWKPAFLDLKTIDRYFEGLRKAGMPEE